MIPSETVPHRTNVATFVFDGHCVMCSGFARYVADRDPGRRIDLIASQSAEGEALYRSFGLDGRDPTTNLVVDTDGRILTGSESSLRILELVGWPIWLIAPARAVPLSIRERIYAFVARNRFRVFGRRETCKFSVREGRS